MNANLTFSQFIKRFPDDDICLDTIFQSRFSVGIICPKCKSPSKFYRVKSRKCYECGVCGHHLYPLSGTIMEGTTTKLTTWFYVIYLFSVSKNGVSAKELERSLGVTYKTAWRIGHKIREVMGSGETELLTGIVETDETLFGGKAPRGGKRGWGAANKTCLLGMMERGGKVKVVPIENRDIQNIFPAIHKYVEKGSVIHTDEFRAYNSLPDQGYHHEKVVHSRYQWRSGDIYTNSIEGYWSNLKKSILGTHTFVSPKHLQKYLDEFDFRHNNRKGKIMFDEILKRVV